MDCFLVFLFIIVIFAIFICLENSGYLKKSNKPQIIEGVENWTSTCIAPEVSGDMNQEEYTALVEFCYSKSQSEDFIGATTTDEKRDICETPDETDRVCVYVPPPRVMW